MDHSQRKKISFRRVVERNFPHHPIQQIARRSYLIAINSLVHQRLSNSIRINGSNALGSSLDSYELIPLRKEDASISLSRSKERARSQAAGSMMRSTVVSVKNHIPKQPSRNRFKRTGVFEVYQKLEFGQRSLKIQQKKSEGQLKNPFYKIQKSRVATLPSCLITQDTIKQEHREPSARAPALKPKKQQQAQALSTRQRSVTVKYNEIKHYFERKYG